MKYKKIKEAYKKSLSDLKESLSDPKQKGSKSKAEKLENECNELGCLLAIAKAAEKAGLGESEIKLLAANC